MSKPSAPAPEPQENVSPALVVERKSSDCIVIGGDIEIALLAVNEGRVHIGVIAPDGTRIA